MININALLEMIDFEVCDDDANDLHKYLNYEINGIEYEDSFKIKKYFKNMLKHLKSLI